MGQMLTRYDVEKLDFKDCINKYNDQSCLIYLDPPYWTEDYYSNNDFDSQNIKYYQNYWRPLLNLFIIL